MKRSAGLSRRGTIVLLVASSLAGLGWMAAAGWFRTSGSGWAAVARHFAAAGHEFGGGRGPTTVTLTLPGRPPFTFAQRHRGPYLEMGLRDDGFWLRSLHGEPSPALFVPWTAVRRCIMFSAWVVLPQDGGPVAEARFTIHDDHFERACRARVGRRAAVAG